MTEFIKTNLKMLSEDKWLEIRHPYLGSSDIPTILGEGYSGSTYWQVWHEKSMPYAPPLTDAAVSDRIWWGKQMQNIIGEGIMRQLGWVLVEGDYHIADPKLKIAATVDFTATRHDIDGLGIIETKNRDWLFHRDRYVDGKAWVYDEIQLAAQMMLHPDVTWGCIGVLVGGNDLKVYDYRREELQRHMDTIRSHAQVFWGKVERRDEPKITFVDLPLWVADRAALQDDPEPIAMPDEIDGEDADELITTYLRMKDLATTAKKAADNLKAVVLQTMGDHKQAQSPGFWLTASRRNVKERTQTVAAHTQCVLTVKERGFPTADAKPDEATLKKAAEAQAPL